jgi:hypothetical protein
MAAQNTASFTDVYIHFERMLHSAAAKHGKAVQTWADAYSYYTILHTLYYKAVLYSVLYSILYSILYSSHVVCKVQTWAHTTLYCTLILLYTAHSYYCILIGANLG